MVLIHSTTSLSTAPSNCGGKEGRNWICSSHSITGKLYSLYVPTAYMVEIWPYTERSRGISVFQLFGRLASFFTTFVNPIGLASVGWRYLISYCCWLAFEVVFVYFVFPETFGRTLEELAFSKLFSPLPLFLLLWL